tara:strand:- start:81 stop:902 length:822 start_codon:yes stop_codon:yes gene_type:complete
MKNYLYFGINHQSQHTLTANMTGDVTIDTDSQAALAIGNNDLGGQAFQTLLARADVNVHVIPATVTAAYYGTDYNLGEGGRRASVIGEPVLLTQPETVAWANDSPNPVILFQTGSSTGLAHGVKGKIGDKFIITVKGAGATGPNPLANGTAAGGGGRYVGVDGDGDGSTGSGPDRGKGLSGICAVFPEDGFLGGQILSTSTTAVFFKTMSGDYDRDVITFTHGANKGKQLLEEVTALANAGKQYAGMMRVYDGVQPQFSLLSPGLGIVGITIT